MSSPLTWRDEWLLGIGRLDADHREMVRLFNRLIEVGRDPGGRGSDPHEAGWNGLLDRLQDLIDHLRRHFVTEEAFLRGIGYPECSTHANEHALHIAELVDLHRRLSVTKAPRIDEEGLEALKEWLFDHIDEDRGFARYYWRSVAQTDRKDRTAKGWRPASRQRRTPWADSFRAFAPAQIGIAFALQNR